MLLKIGVFIISFIIFSFIGIGFIKSPKDYKSEASAMCALCIMEAIAGGLSFIIIGLM